MALCSIPACFPEQAVVIDLAKLGALVRREGVGVDDALLLHIAGAQADPLAGVLLSQAPGREGVRRTIIKAIVIITLYCNSFYLF